MTLKRIQRKRTNGWRMPPGAIYVGRGSHWGNPWTTDNSGQIHPAMRFACETAPILDVSPLAGHDLACWCHLCDDHKDGLPIGVECDKCAPCHADVLLALANPEENPT